MNAKKPSEFKITDRKMFYAATPFLADKEAKSFIAQNVDYSLSGYSTWYNGKAGTEVVKTEYTFN